MSKMKKKITAILLSALMMLLAVPSFSVTSHADSIRENSRFYIFAEDSLHEGDQISKVKFSAYYMHMKGPEYSYAPNKGKIDANFSNIKWTVDTGDSETPCETTDILVHTKDYYVSFDIEIPGCEFVEDDDETTRGDKFYFYNKLGTEYDAVGYEASLQEDDNGWTFTEAGDKKKATVKFRVSKSDIHKLYEIKYFWNNNPYSLHSLINNENPDVRDIEAGTSLDNKAPIYWGWIEDTSETNHTIDNVPNAGVKFTEGWDYSYSIIIADSIIADYGDIEVKLDGMYLQNNDEYTNGEETSINYPQYYCVEGNNIIINYHFTYHNNESNIRYTCDTPELGDGELTVHVTGTTWDVPCNAYLLKGDWNIKEFVQYATFLENFAWISTCTEQEPDASGDITMNFLQGDFMGFDPEDHKFVPGKYTLIVIPCPGNNEEINNSSVIKFTVENPDDGVLNFETKLMEKDADVETWFMGASMSANEYFERNSLVYVFNCIEVDELEEIMSDEPVTFESMGKTHATFLLNMPTKPSGFILDNGESDFKKKTLSYNPNMKVYTTEEINWIDLLLGGVMVTANDPGVKDYYDDFEDCYNCIYNSREGSYDVIVRVTYDFTTETPKSSGSKTYKATDKEGSVAKIAGSGKKGSTRTITPIEGKKVGKVTITDKEGNKIDVTNNEDGTYSFIQPASDVNVEVTYVNREITLNIGSTLASVDDETTNLDVCPVIRNDRTMLPIRFVAENLGAKVEWNEKNPNYVLITREDTKIEITLGSDKMLVNGKEVKLDSVAFAENDRTYLPVRAVSENLNAIVEWNEAKPMEVKIYER